MESTLSGFGRLVEESAVARFRLEREELDERTEGPEAEVGIELTMDFVLSPENKLGAGAGDGDGIGAGIAATEGSADPVGERAMGFLVLKPENRLGVDPEEGGDSTVEVD